MTWLCNAPADFADEMKEGFAAAAERWVRPVPGGVVRSTEVAPGSVAVVIGGGSGHYPAFGGLVGQGLAHGAVMGNLFASPSSRQVHSVATAADAGGGILFTYGNYAGDVLNFDQAQRWLRAEGIECATVTVTDDICSAPRSESSKRRGVAGDLAVFKVASAAAEAGYPLAEVARVAASANARTRSLAVAFTGCTLPGATEPLFTVPKGRMAVGLGIHGEPGIEERDIPTADELAELFTTSLLAEVPDEVRTVPGSRVCVIVNGLGAVKYEELFVVYRRVEALLAEAGIVIVEPEVGEVCTSFDMAGVSLTMFWLDDELESLWRAPADTPGYRKGYPAPATRVAVRDRAVGDAPALDTASAVPDATPESREIAAAVLATLERVSVVVDENADELGRIDAVAGDGDHGIGMRRGASAALAAAAQSLTLGAGAGTLLQRAADAWADRAGGTSGALWGAGLSAVAARIGDHAVPDARDVSDAVADALTAVVRFGKAQAGDKTLVDVLIPFSEVLERETSAGMPLAEAWDAAADAAAAAAAATAGLLPRIGRARPHAQRSIGTRDAGAVSLALIVRAAQSALAR